MQRSRSVNQLWLFKAQLWGYIHPALPALLLERT